MKDNGKLVPVFEQFNKNGNYGVMVGYYDPESEVLEIRMHIPTSRNLKIEYVELYNNLSQSIGKIIEISSL